MERSEQNIVYNVNGNRYNITRIFSDKNRIEDIIRRSAKAAAKKVENLGSDFTSDGEYGTIYYEEPHMHGEGGCI